MDFIKVTAEYGLVVRRDALQERGVSRDQLLRALEVQTPLGESDRLLSFGPCFGREALDVFIVRLSEIGLSYFNDFVEIVGDYPAWCDLRMAGMPRVRDGG